MITRTLIAGLERAQSPKAVQRITRALEMVTGVKTTDLVFEPSDVEAAKWFRAHGGFSSHSGISVSADKALESSVFLGCIKVISEDIGRLPMFLYKRDGKDVEKATDHTLFRLLHDLPNPDTNPSAFFEATTAQALLGGEGFCEIIRDSKKRVIQLWPMTNGPVTRRKNTNNRPIFKYKDGNSAEKEFSADKVFNLPGWSIDGVSGDPILQRLRQVLGLTLAAQQYAGNFFANDASPGVILTRKEGLPALDDPTITAIKTAWKKWHQGGIRAHEPAILQDGFTLDRHDPDHTKLQLVEQRKFQVIEICRAMRMSPHMLADLDRATFSNIEQLYNQHLTLTLVPWLKRWRQSVYRCLLSEDERAAGYYAEHNVEDFQRGLFKDQALGFSMLLEKGVYTINEVRRWYNLNPVQGGDDPYIQLNRQLLTAAVDAAINEPDPELAKFLPAPIRKLLTEKGALDAAIDSAE